MPSSEAEAISESLKGLLYACERNSLGALHAIVPVGIQNGSGMPAEEGYLLRDATLLVQGDDGEGATTAGFPVDGDVFRVRLYYVVSANVLGSSVRKEG